MAKHFLTLMLLTMQVLTGIGMSVYLCIGPGGVYCLNSEADACSLCPDNRGGHEDDGSPCSCCGRKHHEEPEQLAGDPCGCQHIQLSGGNPSSGVRPVNVIDAEQLLALVAWLPLTPSFDNSLPSASLAHLQTHGPARAPSALAALSTVVIRC